MKSKKIRNFIFMLFVLLIVIIIVFMIAKNAIQDKYLLVFELSTLIIGPIVSIVIGWLSRTYKIIVKPYVWNEKMLKTDKIRISFAYLIRIRIGTKYLLINHERNKVFQPIGGVYHYSINKDFLINKFGFQADHSHRDTNDFRGYIFANKIDKFISWFDKEKDRETTPNREFYEETSDQSSKYNEIFNDQTMTYIKIKSYYEGIQYSSHYDTMELKRFDVYEMQLNKEQESYINGVFLAGDKYRLATNDEIKRLGVNGENYRAQFGTQTVYLREEVYYNE